MYRIIFSNSVGELDRRTAKDSDEAQEVALKMLEEAPCLYKGDSIRIEGDEDDE